MKTADIASNSTRAVAATIVVLLLLASLVAVATPAQPALADIQADEDIYHQRLTDADGWSHFYYKFVAGSTLRPRDSANGWDDDGSGGCLVQDAGSSSGIFNINLDLPEGSRIDYLRIYYYDTSGNDSVAWVTAYDGAGGYDDLVSVSSDGNGGYGTELSAYMGDTVKNYTTAYVLNWRSAQLGNTMRLCGLRVAYRVPNDFVFLPIAIKD